MARCRSASGRFRYLAQPGSTSGSLPLILPPLVFLPYVLWTLEDARTTPSLVPTAEHADATASPDWILWVPRAFLDRESRERIGRLVSSGAYTPRVVRGEAALLVRADRRQSLAYLK